MTRRRMLAVLAALPALARRGFAAPLAPGVYDGTFVPDVWRGTERLPGEAPRRTTVIALAGGDRVALAHPLPGRVERIESITNANDRYQVAIALRRAPRAEAWLVDGDSAVRWRSASDRTTWFIVDRALADRLAAMSGVVRRDRTSIADDICGHWSGPQVATLDRPIELSVEVSNIANHPATVSFGPLGASFTFSIPGVAAAVPMFTGPLAIRTLAPGERFTLTQDLRTFAKLVPGRHRVACELLLEAHAGPGYPTSAAERWDVPLRGTVVVDVRG